MIHTSQTANVPVLLGSTVELGIGTAAFVHLAVSSENVKISSDLVGPGILVEDIISEPFLYNKGELEPYKNPGLGVELDENKDPIFDKVIFKFPSSNEEILNFFY